MGRGDRTIRLANRAGHGGGRSEDDVRSHGFAVLRKRGACVSAEIQALVRRIQTKSPGRNIGKRVTALAVGHRGTASAQRALRVQPYAPPRARILKPPEKQSPNAPPSPRPTPP